jgi:AcrR family transcriptional regulator
MKNAPHQPDKKDIILLVAEKLFAENGFEGTSIRDLAAMADVNLAMISYYFGSKEKLFEELVLRRTSYMREMLEQITASEVGPWEKLYAIIDLYVERILSNATFHKIMFREISLELRTGMTNNICDILSRNALQFAVVINEGIEKKIFRQVDVPLTIATIIGSINHATLSKKLVCSVLKVDFDSYQVNSDEHKTRLKNHLKQMMTSHLQIQNPVI